MLTMALKTLACSKYNSTKSANSRSMYSTAFRIAVTARPGGRGTERSKSSCRTITVHLVRLQSGQLSNGVLGYGKELRVDLDPDALQATRSGRRDR